MTQEDVAPPRLVLVRHGETEWSKAGYGTITTEIVGPPAPEFYFAEDYHQQYLDKVPHGYCPNHSTGVKLPEGFAVKPLQYVD